MDNETSFFVEDEERETSAVVGICGNCNYTFGVNMYGCGINKGPRYCPICGTKFDYRKKSPSEIAEEIKKLYHCERDLDIDSSDEIEKLLNELKKLAEANETKQK